MEQKKKRNIKVGVIKKKTSKAGNEYFVLELGNTFAKDPQYRFDAKVAVRDAAGKVTEVKNGKLFLSVPKDKEGNELDITDKFGGKLLYNVEILEEQKTEEKKF
jgi:hypothetical protein